MCTSPLWNLNWPLRKNAKNVIHYNLASSSKRVFTAGKKGNHGVVLLIIWIMKINPRKNLDQCLLSHGWHGIMAQIPNCCAKYFCRHQQKVKTFYPYTWLFSDFRFDIRLSSEENGSLHDKSTGSLFVPIFSLLDVLCSLEEFKSRRIQLWRLRLHPLSLISLAWHSKMCSSGKCRFFA